MGRVHVPIAVRRSRHALTLATELRAQLILCAREHVAARLREVRPGTIDVKRQHRHCGAVRIALAASAALRRARQRSSDRLRIGAGENVLFEIERVARFGDALRPAFLGRRFFLHAPGRRRRFRVAAALRAALFATPVRLRVAAPLRAAASAMPVRLRVAAPLRALSLR
jgi:hypothetical protein